MKLQKLETISEISGSVRVAVNILDQMLNLDGLQNDTLRLELSETSLIGFLSETINPFYIQVI